MAGNWALRGGEQSRNAIKARQKSGSGQRLEYGGNGNADNCQETENAQKTGETTDRSQKYWGWHTDSNDWFGIPNWGQNQGRRFQ